jgi:SNF2 family DNA or RNA helicase
MAYRGGLRLVVDRSRGRGGLKLVGSLKRLNRPQRFFLERYFSRWQVFMDIRRYPEFRREAPHFKLQIEAGEEVEKFYDEEIARRTITFDARAASGEGLTVVLKTEGDRLYRPLQGIVGRFAGPDMALRDPLDAFGVEERVKDAQGVVAYSERFSDLFPRFMRDRVSLEASVRFHRQIAVRHLAPALSDDIGEVVADFVDENHLLREPHRAREFTDEVQRAGAKLRITDDARELARFYELRENLRVEMDGADEPPNLKEDTKRGALKTGLKQPLYRFQEKGVAHLFLTERALLADDMGLGKTVQAIAAALAAGRYKRVKRVLVVCPASLKVQWQREIERFADEPALVIGGDAKAREEAYAVLAGGDAPLFAVMNYELTYRDLDKLKKLPIDLLIIDEAQRIKNYRTKTYSAIKSLQHRFLFALTGTPLENELDELYNIVRLINRDVLPKNPILFRERYCTFDAFGKITGYRRVPEVSQRIAAITLRRTKRDVLEELPPVIEQSVWLEFDKEQRAIYEDVKRGIADSLSWEQWRELDVKNLLVQLMRLREVCDSPRMHFPEKKPAPKERELIVVLKEQVEERRGQAVVFTQWTRMAEILEEQIREAGLAVAYLHGGVESARRAELVDEFQRGKYHVFLSTDAGGVGLNLQVASLIVNFDLPFNPAKVEQRIGRAHRLGQDEPVNVLNLLMSRSVEENLVRILARRQKLFEDIFSAWDEGGRPEQVTLDEWLRDSRKLARELLKESDG